MFIYQFVKSYRFPVYEIMSLEKTRNCNTQIAHSEQYIKAVPSQDHDGTIIQCSPAGNNLKRLVQ